MSSSRSIRRDYVDVDGLQLHYRVAGEQNLPPLLLLHQSPSSSVMYESLMRMLAPRYRIFAPDFPGFGGSDALPDSNKIVSIADYARFVHGFCQALNLHTMYVFGHHTGSAVAVQMEHDFPGFSKAMVLSGPALLTDAQKNTLPQLASEFPILEDGSHLQSMWQRLRAKDPEAPLDLTLREMLSAFHCGTSYPESYKAVTRQPFATQLAAVKCPVLVFAGDGDPLYSAVEPSLALLSDGSKVDLPGGERTYVCDLQAGYVAGVLDDFITDLGDR